MTSKKEMPKQRVKPIGFNDSENEKVEKVLIENFASLQKVMTNLALKFDDLSRQISKLLELFEISAKTIAEKGGLQDEARDDKKLAEKLDSLLDQNKVIAKGIALLHDTEETQEPTEQRQMPPIQRQPSQYALPPIRRIGSLPPQQQTQRINVSRDPRFNEMNR